MLFISIERFFQRKQNLSFRFLIQSINLFLLFVLKYASTKIMVLKEQNAFNLLQKKNLMQHVFNTYYWE